MRIPFSKAFFLITLLIFISFLTVLFSFPKALLIDRFLMERGIHLIASRAEEGLTDVSLENVRVFYGKEEVARFGKLELRIGLLGLEVEGKCNGGRGKLNLGYLNRDLEVDLKSLRCLRRVGEVNGKLLISDGSLKGDLSVSDLRLEGLKIASLRLRFMGRNFEGDIDYMGMNLRGGGSLKLDLNKPENSSLRASFRGEIGTLLVEGKLSKISVQLR